MSGLCFCLLFPLLTCTQLCSRDFRSCTRLDMFFVLSVHAGMCLSVLPSGLINLSSYLQESTFLVLDWVFLPWAYFQEDGTRWKCTCIFGVRGTLKRPLWVGLGSASTLVLGCQQQKQTLRPEYDPDRPHVITV